MRKQNASGAQVAKRCLGSEVGDTAGVNVGMLFNLASKQTLVDPWTRKKKPRRNTNEQTPSATPVQSVAEVAYGRRCCGIDFKRHQPPRYSRWQRLRMDGSHQRTPHLVCYQPTSTTSLLNNSTSLTSPRKDATGTPDTVRLGVSPGVKRCTYHAATIFNSYDIKLVAVDAAYSSIWGARDWQPALNSSRKQSGTRHDAGSVVLGRRSQGHGPRRNPGTPRNDQSRKAGSRKQRQGVFLLERDPQTPLTPFGAKTGLLECLLETATTDPAAPSRVRQDSPAGTAKNRTGRH